MAAVYFPKTKVVFLSRGLSYLIKIWHADRFNFHLLKQTQSLNLHPEVHFRLYGRHLEKSI